MTIPIYDKYGNSQSPAPAQTTHGMTGAQIDELHQRFGSFSPSIVHTGNQSSSFQNLFQNDLPDGASWDKSAQVSPTMQGGGPGRQLTTVQTPYQPEFASPDRQQYPVHRILANRYWRLFYKLDPVIGNCVDLYADLPWSNFELTGEGIEGEVRQAYEYMCRETQVLALLPYFVREFLVVGEVIPHLFFDQDRGVFTHIALHNPDQIEVTDAPFIKMDPILEFIPDDRLRAILTSDQPALRRIRETMPSDLINRLNARQNIPLSSMNATFIPRKLHPYDTRGTSIISRMWRILMLEDAVFNAQIQIARRHAGPLKVAKLGNAQTGWIPPPEQEKRLLELLAQAELDPNAWLVYHYGIQFDMIGTTDKVLSVNREWDTIERIKLIALGVSKSFLHGEVTYACLPEGAPIRTPSDNVPIQNIKAGDVVVDKDGIEQIVESQWCEGVPDELTEITLWGGKTVSATCNHKWPVWAWLHKCACGCGEDLKKPGKCFLQHHHEKTGGRYNTVELKYVDGETAVGGKPRQIPVNYDPVQKLRSDELRPGDYLMLPRKFSVVTPNISLEQARLLGYYVAEGNLCKNKDKSKYVNVRWTMNINEYNTWILDIKNACTSIGISTNMRQDSVRNASQITTSGPEAVAFTSWIDDNAAHYSYLKKLSDDVMHWPLDYKLELIRGAFRGDGSQYFHSTRNRYGSKYRTFIVCYNTVSKELAQQMQQILIQLGYYSSISTEAPRIGKDGSPRRELYLVATRGIHARRLADAIWGDTSLAKDLIIDNPIRDRYRVDDEYIYVPIKSVKTIKNSVPVYNLSVSGSHSYLVDGVGTYNSSATGLQVFMQRLKVMRMFFEQRWLYPKFFRPVAEINGWIKPKPAQVAHHFKVKRSSKELEEQNAYLLPKVIWDKSLDQQVNSEIIQAMTALESLGVKFSKTTKMAAVGYSYEEETKKIQREHQFEKQFLPVMPGKEEAGAGGGGGLGGGGGPPPPPTDADEDKAQTPPGLGGEVPPGVNAPGAPPVPPKPPGASIEVKGDEGEAPKDSGTPKPAKSSHDNLKSQIWQDDKFGNWDAEEVSDLIALLETGETDSAFWHQLSIDMNFKEVALSRDPDVIWESIDNYLISHDYPEKDIKELQHILEQEKWLVPTSSKQMFNDIETALPDGAENMSDEQFASLVAREIKKNGNKISSDNTHLLTGLSGSNMSNLMGDISDLMRKK